MTSVLLRACTTSVVAIMVTLSGSYAEADCACSKKLMRAARTVAVLTGKNSFIAVRTNGGVSSSKLSKPSRNRSPSRPAGERKPPRLGIISKSPSGPRPWTPTDERRRCCMPASPPQRSSIAAAEAARRSTRRSSASSSSVRPQLSSLGREDMPSLSSHSSHHGTSPPRGYAPIISRGGANRSSHPRGPPSPSRGTRAAASARIGRRRSCEPGTGMPGRVAMPGCMGTPPAVAAPPSQLLTPSCSRRALGAVSERIGRR